MRGCHQPISPTASAPIAGHHIQCSGRWSNASSTAYTARVMSTAASPTTAPSGAQAMSAAACGQASTGTAKKGWKPSNSARTTSALAQAAITGSSEAGLNSNSSSSTASSTAASGVPKTAAMPAAAPAASSTFLSWAVMGTNCPTTEPSAPPVAMIGPSAPNGPPVPMEMAADSGLRNSTRGAMRLRLVSTCSIASGMPWPRIAGEPQRAIAPTIKAPTTGTAITQAPRALGAGVISVQPMRPKKLKWVIRPMSASSNCATSAAAAPMSTASSRMNKVRGRTRPGWCSEASACSSGCNEGATGRAEGCGVAAGGMRNAKQQHDADDAA